MLYRPHIDQSLFVGRKRELQLLDNLWASSNAELLILYGRRRVGKTRLLTHWLDKTQPRLIFWVAEPTSHLDQLRSFSQAVYRLSDSLLPVPEDFAFPSWGHAIQELARYAQDERLVVILDEFTYLLEIDPGIAGTLQNLWDHLLKHTNLFLCLSGSHIGMMQRHVLAYQAPLYGRATALLQLFPLPFGDTSQYFPGYRPDERVAVYAMAGGIPAYWELFDPGKNLDENIRNQFLTPNRLLHDEPRLLLHDFLSDTHNYVSILRAIAHGRRTPKEIAVFTGLKDSHIPAYLSKLIETGFVERRLPVTAVPSSRRGRHHITDPFLRFYYRFLFQRQQQITMGIEDKALAEIKRHLRDFIGTHTWEELCQMWLLFAGSYDRLPFQPDQIGSVWTRKIQVDVAGYNSMEKTLILGECKWGTEPMGRSVIRKLVDKTSEAVPERGKWQIYYLGFARGGWTDAAHSFAQEVSHVNEKGKNWEVVGMALLDLTQVDQDLKSWSDQTIPG